MNDSIVSDSLFLDSVAMPVIGEEMAGIVLVNPSSGLELQADAGNQRNDSFFGMSWIYLALALLFCVTGLKFKGSARYLKTIVDDMIDTRLRHNAFDDTVKETSLIVLLNVLWVACAGIMLWIGVNEFKIFSAALPASVFEDAAGIGICMAIAAVYICLMLFAYWVVGNVFSDRGLTLLWIKGAAASTGLQTFLLFPIAVVALNYTEWSYGLVIAALAVFILGKIVFFYKGFRIFFTQIASWLLFLYYLCSLEIIPVIITFAATVEICSQRA